MKSARDSKKIGVLLVDDHPVVRDGYRHLLEKTPDILVLAEAGDGETACALYEQIKPDVVVLDLSMPGMGGLEIIRRILSRDAAAHILVFSMHDSETLILRALKAGATGYLTKQSGMHQMMDAVREVARGKMFILSEHLQNILRQLAKPSDHPLQILSQREFQLFQLLAEGHSVVEIAAILSLSPKTVGVHHASIMKKLGLKNAAQLVRLAMDCKVIGSV